MENKVKTILITGANSGIGKATAKILSKEGHHIIMLGRNEGKLNNARSEIIKDSKNKSIDITTCDLMDMDDIKRAGGEIRAHYSGIDVLINNAGRVFGSKKLTKEGFERTFALNHLAYFVLTHELLPLIRNREQGRIINVSSGAHHQMKEVDWDNLQAEKSFGEMPAYALSKLANIYFTAQLAKKLQPEGIITNSLHPGVVRTSVTSQGSVLMKLMFAVYWPFMISTEKGAATSVFLASSPEASSVSGKYFINKKEKWPSRLAQREDLAEKMWETSLKLTGISNYGVPE